MPELSYHTQRVSTLADETVLQALTRQGIAVRSSCRGGTCQTCVMRCHVGDIPSRAQSGLHTELIAKRYFLPCVCKPSSDMLLDDALVDDFFVPAQLELRQENERGITFMFEPLRSLPTTITTVVVRDEAGIKTRLLLATQPALDYYFGIEILNDDMSALAMHWRTHLQMGAQIDMREAIADELLVQPPRIITEVERPKNPPPDLELWSALGEGVLMNNILKDFYARVYADSQLQPFFSGFTQQRLIEKQYSFMQQLMTGNKVYFGNRPRNTHHWMVISDELFAHREQLMLESMRNHGLAEKWIVRWLAIENYYRTDIVKTHPFPRQINGIDLPLEGFDTLVLDVGALCDGCGGSIEPGETVRYHVRLGTVFCARCGSL